MAAGLCVADREIWFLALQSLIFLSLFWTSRKETGTASGAIRILTDSSCVLFNLTFIGRNAKHQPVKKCVSLFAQRGRAATLVCGTETSQVSGLYATDQGE
jgi:hypothetical protein